MPYSDPQKQKSAVKNYRVQIQTNIDFLIGKSNKFWEHVEISDPSECWPWKDSSKTIKANAGLVGCWNDVSAPRIAIELDIGKILPPDYQVKHICPDNPLCCNPLHLRQSRNWVNDRKCISCNMVYGLKPPESCDEPLHLKYWNRDTK